MLAGPAALLVAAAAPLAAQGDCFPGPESNEAKTLAIKSVALAFGPARAPSAAPRRGVRVALETSYLPAVDAETRTPTICRPGKGPENANLLDGFLRPRVAVVLPAGFVAEVAWVPPVRLADVKANLVGIGVGRAMSLTERAVLAVRAHGTFGRIRAPFTCPEEALADPASTCFQGSESDDRYDPNIFGAELAVGWGGAETRLRPYLGIGYSRLQPRFQVNFTNRVGELDNRKVTVDLTRAVVFGGMTWALSGRLGLSGEIYSAPSDAVTGRVVVEARLGR